MNNEQDGAALMQLRNADPRMAAIIDRVGPYEIQITPEPFVALLASIIHQQLSMKAAATIHGRVKSLCPRGRLTPKNITSLPDDALRGAGLSRQKVRFVRDLCAHFLDRRLTPAGLRHMNDEEVVAAATQVLGIGKWTAEMLLMFCLGRPDVWPIDDLGLQKAAMKLLRKRKPLERAALEKLGDRYRPHRTCATWYLWRSLDGEIAPGLKP